MTRDKTMCSGVVIHEKKIIKLELFTFFFTNTPTLSSFVGFYTTILTFYPKK